VYADLGPGTPPPPAPGTDMPNTGSRQPPHTPATPGRQRGQEVGGWRALARTCGEAAVSPGGGGPGRRAGALPHPVGLRQHLGDRGGGREVGEDGVDPGHELRVVHGARRDLEERTVGPADVDRPRPAGSEPDGHVVPVRELALGAPLGRLAPGACPVLPMDRDVAVGAVPQRVPAVPARLRRARDVVHPPGRLLHDPRDVAGDVGDAARGAGAAGQRGGDVLARGVEVAHGDGRCRQAHHHGEVGELYGRSAQCLHRHGVLGLSEPQQGGDALGEPGEALHGRDHPELRARAGAQVRVTGATGGTDTTSQRRSIRAPPRSRAERLSPGRIPGRGGFRRTRGPRAGVGNVTPLVATRRDENLILAPTAAPPGGMGAQNARASEISRPTLSDPVGVQPTCRTKALSGPGSAHSSYQCLTCRRYETRGPPKSVNVPRGTPPSPVLLPRRLGCHPAPGGLCTRACGPLGSRRRKGCPLRPRWGVASARGDHPETGRGCAAAASPGLGSPQCGGRACGRQGGACGSALDSN